MQTPRQWSDEPELFEAVALALEQAASAADEGDTIRSVMYRDERDEYGEQGTITVRTADGRTFKLLLAEVR